MRVAIFGAGYAGLGVARRLERTLPDDDDLVVVDESGEHVVRHLLHRGIRYPEELAHVRLPLGTVLERATIREASVEALDHTAGVATLADGETLAYDLGVVTLGGEPEFYGLEDVIEHATPLHRPSDVETIRADFEAVLEDGGRVVVGGGGLTGIQTAGELAALARHRDASETVEVTLLEQSDAVPPGFDDRLQTAVGDALEAAGVVLHPSTTITGATADAVAVADGEPIPYEQFVWAGGIQGPVAQAGDRPTVPATLRLSENAFALGDAAQVVDADGTRVPPTAHAAIRQAGVAATNVTRVIEYRRENGGFAPRLERYRHDETGWLVSVGDDAVAKVGPTLLRGDAAKAVKTTVGAGYLSSIGAFGDAGAHLRETVFGQSPDA
ncbi:FAD-dependent pyridine nucleotide-disulphide oxidoreductase [Halorhabdus utahensis DSM 12940]|uniref:FAD-dependent pyridine nucleotide-disulphide oxidoreductase n=1 Tax=Halorhabdus utahensis (strain DSM 12940 / JCM 11049 / AX-2) TaxID=519442 RepID=C7NTF4_HALUD|nr:FAD-dependent oxidoreductase [Halorhabdus utahensis]ACV10876.1 FAD-dependent pyridine nucleotide-disulphide oxidoreductase [Halorhabdus utahensis DSM 12940]